MKKLMTTIAAAAAAFGLYAADPVEALHGASMETDENYEVGQGVVGFDDYWVTDGDDESVVTAYGEETAPEHLNYGCFWMDQLNYLKVEAEQPLYRAIATPTGTKTENLVPADIATAERDGIIIDQLVKFSAFDAETEKIDVEKGAKIAVWVKAGEEDDGTGTLQITTAELDAGTFEPVEKTVNTGIEVDTAKWYQLKITTIKAADVDGDTVPGFIIELDGEAVAKAENLWPVVDPWDKCLTAQAKKLIDENKLFPSMVVYGSTGADTLLGVAYKGTGSIDDVAVANYVAEVPPAPTYTLAVTEPKEEEGTLTTDPAAGQIEAGTEVTVTATPSEGYELVSITTNGQVLVGITFEMPAEDVTVAATFKKAGGEYPPEWPDADPEIAAKFAEWSAGPGKGADLSTDAAKNAFLLNVSVDDVKDLKIESIDVDAEGYAAIVVSAPGETYFDNIDLGEINGVLFVEAGETLDAMEPKAVTDWITTSGKAVVKIQANFIKAVIGFKTPEVPADTIKVGEVEE